MAQLLTTTMQDVPNYSSVGALKRQRGIQDGRDMIEIDPSSGNVQRLNDADILQPGPIYLDVPRYVRGAQNVARMTQEMALLKLALPDDVNIVTDPPNYSYVLLEDFPLGSDYSPSYSHVLLRIPREYPQIPPGLTSGHGIYIMGGVTRHSHPLQCTGTSEYSQYHWDCAHNPSDMREKGWAWWCFKSFSDWDPNTDNIFKLVTILAETLQHPAAQRIG